MELPLAGQAVSRVAFDYAVTLWTDGGGELRVETPFTITGGGGAAVRVVPAAAAGSAALLVGLLKINVETASVADDGTLRLRLAGGGTIEVGPDEQFEAWTFAGPKGEKAVCMPGGGLTTWGLK
jgi:hypothetical protein